MKGLVLFMEVFSEEIEKEDEILLVFISS